MAEPGEALRAPGTRSGARNKHADLAKARDRSGEEKRPASPWLADLVLDGTSENLLRRLGEFRGSVHRALVASSKEYRVLATLEQASLAGTETCAQALRQQLAANPHYVLVCKLAEAEAAVAGICARQ